MNNHESLVYWSDESQLMGYGESDSSGCWLKFQIHSEDMDKFRGLKGTVFHLTMVKIQDDGEPEKQKEKPYADKPIGPLCREANDLCQYKEFQEFLRVHMGQNDMPFLTPHYAAIAVRRYCDVTTKKAIDYEQDKALLWGRLKDYFSDWQNERAAGI